MDRPTEPLLREPLMPSSEGSNAGGSCLEEQAFSSVACSSESSTFGDGKRRHQAHKDQTTSTKGALPAKKSRATSFDIIRLVVAIAQLVWPFFISFVLPNDVLEIYVTGSVDDAMILSFAIILAGNLSLIILLVAKHREYQRIEQQESESGENDAGASSGKLHHKSRLQCLDAAPSLCCAAYGIASLYEDNDALDKWTMLCFLFWGLLFIYLLYSLIFRKGSPIRRLFKQMEEEHFDHLRDTAHEREAKLQKQMKQLAYLEENAAARRVQSSGLASGTSFLHTNCSPRQQWMALGLVVILIWGGFETCQFGTHFVHDALTVAHTEFLSAADPFMDEEEKLKMTRPQSVLYDEQAEESTSSSQALGLRGAIVAES